MSFTDFTIQELGPQGDGVVRSPRGVVFIDRALPGDRVRSRVFKDGSGINRGQIEEFLEKSPYRQEALCPHYKNCGNCSLQHLQDKYYREWKTFSVREAFLRRRLKPQVWNETTFLENARRRRLNFTALKRKGQITVGYYRRRSKEVTDIQVCEVIEPELLALKSPLKGLLKPFLKEGQPVDIFLQKVGNAVDLVFTGVPPFEVPLTFLEKHAIVRVSFRKDLCDKVQTTQKVKPLLASFGKLIVELPPAAFLQPTQEGENALVKAVLAALPSQGRMADLFSGCGTFTGHLLERGSVEAFESDQAAVASLSRAGQKLPLKVFKRDLFRFPLRREELNRYEAIVFDPPRAGSEEQAYEMAQAKCSTLVAVSCNPATLARDAQILCEGGYWLQSVQAVDQFKWSHHIEVVAVFTRKKRGRT